MPGKSLGLIMIARNEEQNLDKSLKPLAGLFDEVVVVDTGSTDKTRKKAAGFGARIVELEWPGDFSQARNRSIEAATADYLFWLDGDNALDPQAVVLLRETIDQAEGPVIGWCTEVLTPRGERLLQKRLFPRQPDIRFKGRVHEQLEHPSELSYVHLPVEIIHWGYQDPKEAREKGERNLSLLIEELKAAPDNFYLLYQAGKTIFQLRDFKRAEEYLAQATAGEGGPAENPELYSHAWVLWALAAERTARPKEAEARLRQALAAPLPQPGQGLVRFHLGRLAARRDDWPEAAEHLTAFESLGVAFLTLDLDAEQTAFTAACLLAKAEENQGRLDQAELYYRRASSIMPDNPVPLRDLARLWLKSGRPDQARQIVDRLLAAWPDDRVALDLKKQLA